MIKFDLEVRIYRPLQEVFAFVATPENDFHWQYGTLMSAQIADGKIGTGTLFRAVGHFMGRRMESVYEIMEFEPNKKYGFRSLSGVLDSHTLYTFDVHKGATRIGIFAQFDSDDPLMVTGPALEKSLRKQYKENLNLLKEILETNQVAKRSDKLAAF
jgi:hypothetical protein